MLSEQEEMERLSEREEGRGMVITLMEELKERRRIKDGEVISSLLP